MIRIKPINRDTADCKTVDTLKAVEKKLGTLPNIFTTFAQSPAALNSYIQQNEALASGQLSPRQRELISLAVAQENACQYCLSAHSAIGRAVGLNDYDIELAREGGAANPVDNAIIRFVFDVIRTRADISDEDLAKARKDGLTDELIIEIIANIALNVLTNYLNKIAGTEIDFPIVSLQQTA